MDTYYFVCYVHKIKSEKVESEVDEQYRYGNAIVKNKHPLVWMCEPHMGDFIYYVLWWKEIPKRVAMNAMVIGYIGFPIEEAEDENPGLRLDPTIPQLHPPPNDEYIPGLAGH